MARRICHVALEEDVLVQPRAGLDTVAGVVQGQRAPFREDPRYRIQEAGGAVEEVVEVEIALGRRAVDAR